MVFCGEISSRLVGIASSGIRDGCRKKCVLQYYTVLGDELPQVLEAYAGFHQVRDPR